MGSFLSSCKASEISCLLCTFGGCSGGSAKAPARADSKNSRSGFLVRVDPRGWRGAETTHIKDAGLDLKCSALEC